MNMNVVETTVSTFDYRQFAILYVDDEEMSLKYFSRAFGEQFRIFTAPSAQQGWELLQAHKDEIGILITDQRMPGEKGTWLLSQARQFQPRILRMLTTAFADMEAAIAAVNSGAIYKYINKPWDPPELEATLKRGLEFFQVQRERDQLLHEKISVLRNTMIADRIVSLGLLAAGLSHHIRNSLVAVKTFLDLTPTKLQEEKVAPESLQNPDFWKEYYQNAQRQIERINKLLKDLWSASEAQSPTFNDQVNLGDIIREAVGQVGGEYAAKNIQIENRIPDTLPQLTVDRQKFVRLFELLLKDEVVSLPSGTKVSLEARVADVNAPEGAMLEVQVRDNGPGMPQEALRLVFDPFVIRSDTPLEYGINLMACFFIVHHHGGSITAHSEAGQGTTFNLQLPTRPSLNQPTANTQDFLQKAVLNEALWEKLLADQ